MFTRLVDTWLMSINLMSKLRHSLCFIKLKIITCILSHLLKHHHLPSPYSGPWYQVLNPKQSLQGMLALWVPQDERWGFSTPLHTIHCCCCSNHLQETTTAWRSGLFPLQNIPHLMMVSQQLFPPIEVYFWLITTTVDKLKNFISSLTRNIIWM